MFVTLIPWIFFSLVVLVMLGLDLLVFRRAARPVSFKEAVFTSLFWIVLALLFNVYIYYAKGSQDALDFLTGYLIEKSLSVDNLFVFLLIFKYFHTPSHSMHKVLFWGILGAVVMRAVFIALGILLIQKFHWLIYIFGAFLIYSGIQLWREKERKIEPEQNPVLKLFRRFFPVTEKYEDNKFFIYKSGRLFATPLMIVLIAIETTDIIFALDSIPAILAITYDPFIVFTSNIFAILGLRSLYFALSHMMTLFHHLHYGLSFILVFIGTKMCLAEFYPISTPIALGVVFFVLTLAIVTSLIFPENTTSRRDGSQT